MIKNKICFLLCIGIVCISFVLGYMFLARNSFHNDIRVVKENRETGVYDLPYIYFAEDAICPSSMSELYYYIKDRPLDILLSQYLVDPFSSDLNQITLIPIFNKNSSKWEAVFILSAGVDGKMNYEYTIEDTIFTTDVDNLDLFYNSVDDLSLSLPFNPIDYYFGKKDLLVSYYNCKDEFKASGNFWGTTELDSLVMKQSEKAANHKRLPLGRVYSIKLNPEFMLWENDTVFTTPSTDYIASFSFFDKYEADLYKQTNRHRLYGKFDKLDIENKRIDFIMCMSPN